jgi:excinuclease ABC subunit A
MTADYITGKKSIEVPKERRKGNGKKLVLNTCH